MNIEDQHNIYQFRGPYNFLSNFFVCPSPIVVKGIEGEMYFFASVEHAYQAWKSIDYHDRRLIESQPTPKLAKQKGRRINLRCDWSTICQQVMHYFVKKKFQDNPTLAHRLVDTAPKYLYEGNCWGDRYWGVDQATLEGENHLGRILMNIRQSFIH